MKGSLAAAIVVWTLGLIIALGPAIRSRQQRARVRQILSQFAHLASFHALRFSSQEILAGGAIGVDGIGRRILLLIGDGNKPWKTYLLHFSDVRRCCIERSYRPSMRRAGKKVVHEKALSKIVLRFDLRSAEDAVEIVFYDVDTNRPAELHALSRRAFAWQVILSKMITRAPNQGSTAHSK